MANTRIVVADIRDNQFIPHVMTVDLDSGFRMGKLLEDYQNILYALARQVFGITKVEDSVCGFFTSDDTVNLMGIKGDTTYEEFLKTLHNRYLNKRNYFYGEGLKIESVATQVH